MNVSIAIFEVKKQMQKEKLAKANAINERIENLNNMRSLLISEEKLILKPAVRYDFAYFPAPYGADSESYKFIREIIVTAIEAKIKESEKELEAL